MQHTLPANLIRFSLAAALLAGLVWATPALIARAATISVTTTQDENNNDGDCSLREAILSANTDTSVDECARGNGADTIMLLASTYTLSIAGQNENVAASGDLDITADLTITGAGKNDTFIDGAGLDRIFDILNGAVVQITGVTIENGDAGTGDGGGVHVDGSQLTLSGSRIRDSAADYGGGIRIEDEGIATIINSRLSSNTASTGGGLYVGDFPGSASAVVINSLVDGNSVSGSAGGSNGGGLRSAGGGYLTVVNSTVSGNNAELHGGGIHADNVVGLFNVTITNNTADSNGDDSGNGGGVSFSGSSAITTAVITATNTILSGNSDSSPTGDQFHQCSSPLTSGGHNLISSTTGCTITGAGLASTSIDANGLDRALHITGSSNAVEISGVTVQGGSAGGISLGGGNLTLTRSRILNHTTNAGIVVGGGALTLRNSRVAGNTAGGVFVVAAGSAVIVESTLAGNTLANSGAGLSNYGTVTIINSTLSGNSATGSGGGLFNASTAALFNVTVVNNIADSDSNGVGSGGGLSNLIGGSLTLRNTLVADNINDCSGELTSAGYNLIESTANCTVIGDTTGNVVGVNANQGPLQNNGGNTQTHALLAGSPAIDAGNPAGCVDQNSAPLGVDQRGYARANRCDIGAYESGSPGTPTTTNTSLPATATNTPTATRTATRTNTPLAPTATSSATSTPTRTPSPTLTPSVTPTTNCTPGPDNPPCTATPTGTLSATPTATATSTVTRTPTATPSPTSTFVIVLTLTPSATTTPATCTGMCVYLPLIIRSP